MECGRNRQPEKKGSKTSALKKKVGDVFFWGKTGTGTAVVFRVKPKSNSHVWFKLSTGESPVDNSESNSAGG
jgi:hypothetical protein